MSHLAFRLFGPPRLERDGALVHIARRKALACAVYLAMTDQGVSRDTLATLFWPELDQPHARADLRRILHMLNHTLGAGYVVSDQEHVHFDRNANLWLDVDHFRRLLTSCHHHEHSPQHVCQACLPLLASATALYSDDFLTGFSLPDAPDFDRWQWLESERLRRDQVAALSGLVRGHTAFGELTHAISYGRRWVALDPLDEMAQRWLMQLYAWNGERSAALRQYQLCVETLAQELDADPEPATSELAETIRAGRLPPLLPAQALGVMIDAGRRTMPATATALDRDELRVVTVLCAGLSMPEDADDADALAVRTEQLLNITNAACAPYDGYVERLPGGDVLTVFGLDRIHEDDPERAVRAALAMQATANAQRLSMAVGVNTGVAYCSNLAAAVQLTGAVVNLATQLRHRAGAGEVLAGSATQRATQGVFDVAAQELALAGIARPMKAYTILQPRARGAKVHGIEGLRAELMGRELEMQRLEVVLAHVRAGAGQVVLISGDAGVGKSRLVEEFRQRWVAAVGEVRPLAAAAASADAAFVPTWLEGRCVEMATDTGYWPFIELLRHSLSSTDADDSTLAQRLDARLAAMTAHGDLTTAQMTNTVAALSTLLSVRFGAGQRDGPLRLDPKTAQRQTIDAVCAYLLGLAHRGPTAVVFEDVHWSDASSLDLLGYLMETLATVPLLLVCLYRPEQAQAGEPLLALAQQRCAERCTALRLQELDGVQSRQMLASLLAIEHLPEPTRTLLLDTAQGNPFFLEEIVRAQIDSGMLFRQDERWRAHDALTTLTTPETVQSVVLSRVDRLPPVLKQLLQVAAVTGHYLQRRLLAELAPAEIDLDAALATLAAQAFLRQERDDPNAEYAFRHVLVQDAIYHALPSKRRTPMHRQTAEAIERVHAGCLGAYLEQISYHYGRSDAAEKAIEFLVRAGEKAQYGYGSDVSISYFQRALARLDALASTWDLAERWRLAALKGLGIVYWSTSNLDEAEVYLQRAIVQAQTLQAPTSEMAQLYGWLFRLLRWQGRLDELIRIGEAGLARLDEDSHPLEAAIFHGNLIEAFLLKDDRARYHAAQQRIAELLAKLPFDDNLFSSYGYMMLMHRDNNETEQALDWVRFVEHGLQDGHYPLLSLWTQMWQVARYLEAIGDMHGAIANRTSAISDLRKLTDVKAIAWGLNHQAACYLAVGDLANAKTVGEESIQLHRQLGLQGEVMEGTNVLALIRYCQGKLYDAEWLIESALELARQTGFHYALGFQRTLLGSLRLLQGHRQEAETLFGTVVETQHLDAQHSVEVFRALAGLEAACIDSKAFQACCCDLQRRRPELAGLGLRQWWLTPSIPDPDLPNLALDALAAGIATGGWTWVDPFADCAYVLGDTLTIYTANCRGLWANNRSAPRLVHPVCGDFAIQVTCCAAPSDRPAIGGILLWQDEANYLRLTWGELGAAQVAFAGALENRNLLIGRGALVHTGSVLLRLERRGDTVRALCSADEREWFSAGEKPFSASEPLLVGLHAIGDIDRIVWPGAHPDGTAIQFSG